MKVRVLFNANGSCLHAKPKGKNKTLCGKSIKGMVSTRLKVVSCGTCRKVLKV